MLDSEDISMIATAIIGLLLVIGLSNHIIGPKHKSQTGLGETLRGYQDPWVDKKYDGPKLKRLE